MDTIVNSRDKALLKFKTSFAKFRGQNGNQINNIILNLANASIKHFATNTEQIILYM